MPSINQSRCSSRDFKFIQESGKSASVPTVYGGFSWTGDAVKSLAGQGVVYVRLTKDFAVVDLSDKEKQEFPDLSRQVVLRYTSLLIAFNLYCFLNNRLSRFSRIPTCTVKKKVLEVTTVNKFQKVPVTSHQFQEVAVTSHQFQEVAVTSYQFQE